MQPYKPYFQLSGGLNGLAGLGAIAPDVQSIIDDNADDLQAIINNLESSKPHIEDTYSFDDIDALYNIGISSNQKKAWVYYKRKYLNIPMTGGWKKYYIEGTEKELTELIKDGAMYYSEGKYLPLSVFTWGNIYEREATLEQDADYIVSQYGQQVLANHREVLEKARPKQITFNDPDPKRRAVINPTSTLAKTFKISEVRPEFMEDVSDAIQVNHKGRSVTKKKRIEIDWSEDKRYSLRHVFVKWVYTIDQKRYFQPGVTPYMIDNFYVHGGSITEDFLKTTTLKSSEVKSKSREDGEKLFAMFLAEVLTEKDTQRLNDRFNAKYNGWADLNYQAVPIGMEISKSFLGGGFAIRPEKRDAVAYMEAVGSGILAYDVGVGKTVSALLELANAIHQGKCKRPVLVVPNPTYNNWIKEAFGGTDDETGKSFNGILSNLGVKYNDWFNLNTKLVAKLDKAGELDRLIPEGTITFLSYQGFIQLGFSEDVGELFIKEMTEILDQKIDDPTLSESNSTLKGISEAKDIYQTSLDKYNEAGQAMKASMYEQVHNIYENGHSNPDIVEAAKMFINDVPAPTAKKSKSTNKTERDKAKQEKDYRELIGLGQKNAIVDIDVVGFDYIIIDEAHNCKSVFSGVKSDEEGNKNYHLTGSQSTTGLKAFFFCNYIQRKYGRNVLLLTATPFTNSPLEIYSMISLVGYDMLVESGFYNINDFFQQFAKVDSEYVVDYKGDVKVKEVIKGFNNRLILQKLIFTKVNYKTGEDVGVKRPCKVNLPMLNQKIGSMSGVDGDDQILTYLKMNDQQDANQDIIIERMNSALEGKPDMGMLMKMFAESMNNAFSPFLFGSNPKSIFFSSYKPPIDYKEFVDNSPKIKYTVECIRTVKQWHESRNENVSGQVMYSNRGVKFFPMIRQYLIKEVGYKETVRFQGHKLSEVEILAGGEGIKSNDKELVKEAFNAGVVKVIIGSATIREGINLQKKGTVMYDMFPDWNPTDVRQLEGRIWRQGNKFGYVRIAMPLVENSMDVFVFQKLEEKTARINDLFYREGTANVLDLDSIDPGEIKYALIKDIRKLVMMDYAVELAIAQTNLDILEEDAGKVREMKDSLQLLSDSRQIAEENLRNQALSKMANYIRAYGDIDKDNSDYDYYKPRVKYVEKLYQDLQDYLTNPHDEDRLMRFAGRLDNYNGRVGYMYALYDTVRYLKGYTNRVKVIRKLEREVLKPKGYSLEDSFDKIFEEVSKQFSEGKRSFLAKYGKPMEGSDKMIVASEKDYDKTPRFKELYNEIQRKKDELKINGKEWNERVKEFAGLNYLLQWKMGDVDPASCYIPNQNESPTSKPELSQFTADDVINEMEMIEAEAIALQLLQEQALALLELDMDEITTLSGLSSDLWNGKRKPTAKEIEQIKATAWEDWEFHPLPENVNRYFKSPRGAKKVKVSDLSPIRARPKGIANANKYMWLTYWGAMEKRKPISLSKKGRVKYDVADGNSTFANAQLSGWTYLIGMEVAPGMAGTQKTTVSTGKKITRKDYPSLFRDSDGDGIPNVDDPKPFKKGSEQIEEVMLSDEIGKLIDLRYELEAVRDKLVDKVSKIGDGDIKSRSKTPFSMINKMIRKRLLGSKGLTDLVGAMLVVKDQKAVDKALKEIKAGKIGEVLEHENFYKDPLNGYRAHHFIVKVNDIPVELQLKTKRMKAISAGSHTPYKRGKLNGEEMEYLTTLAMKADKGVTTAANKIDAILKDEKALEKRLTK